MSENNGHHNGNGHTTKSDYEWGNGRSRHARSDVRDLTRAVLKGQLSSPEDIAWAYKVLKSIAQDIHADERARAVAAKGAIDILQKAVELGLRKAELDDKIDRLDGGEPTENVRVFDVRIPEARMRLED